MTLRPLALGLPVLLAALAACSTAPQQPAGPGASPAAAPGGSGAPAAAAGQQPAPASRVTTVTLAPHLDAGNSLLRDRSVYFEFDETVVQPEYVPLVERHGRYLASHGELAIKLEGHTDERGSREYNLALGQKRAEAVLKALRLQGVRTSQMEPVSWGEERPRSAGHDESAWARNRRVDLAYPDR